MTVLARRWLGAAAMPMPVPLIGTQHQADTVMPRTLIKELSQITPGTEVSLSGWLQSIR